MWCFEERNKNISSESRGNIIAAREFEWVSDDNLIGCKALLTDGSERLYTEVACPTESEFYYLDDSIHALPFEEKRKLVLAATGLDDREELPWLEYDSDGSLKDGQVESDLLEAWLLRSGGPPRHSCGGPLWSVSRAAIYV